MAKRQMIIETGTLLGKPFGIRVGWRVFTPSGEAVDIWWGNTKNLESLASVIEDARAHGYDFEPPTQAEIDATQPTPEPSAEAQQAAARLAELPVFKAIQGIIAATPAGTKE